MLTSAYIAISDFYNWVRRYRKLAFDQISAAKAANYGYSRVPRLKQDVVPIDVVLDHIPEQYTASQMQNHNFTLYTIQVAIKDIPVPIHNYTNLILLTRIFRLLQKLSC